MAVSSRHTGPAQVQKGALAESIGCSRGGRTTKVHAAVDAHGRLLRLAISGGNVHDSQMMHAFLNWSKPPLAIVAYKAYGSNKIRQQVADEGALCVLLAKSNARHPIAHHPIAHEKNLYAMRNSVECFFCTVKDMCCLATRFEKYATSFLAMLHIFAIRLWIN